MTLIFVIIIINVIYNVNIEIDRHKTTQEPKLIFSTLRQERNGKNAVLASFGTKSVRKINKNGNLSKQNF